MTEEKQGAAEWLRGIADKYESEEYFGCIPMVELFGLRCTDFGKCEKCRAKMMRAIADRIDAERAIPEGVEWPRFEDGELVKVGDTVGSDEPFTAEEIAFESYRWLVKASSRSVCGYFHGHFGEPVKRPTPKVLGADGAPIEVGDTVYYDGEPYPLTVVGITRDGKGALVDANGEESCVEGGCPQDFSHERPDSWEQMERDAKLAPRDYLESRGMNPGKPERIASMMADLVRRAKALAKAGEAE